MSKEYVIFLSEVASLVGENEKFVPAAQTALSVITRSRQKPRFGSQERRYQVDQTNYCLRGCVDVKKDDIPVVIRTRSKLYDRLWPGDRAHCQAVCFLYQSPHCFFMERSKSDTTAAPLTIPVIYDETQWNKLKEVMHINILQALKGSSASVTTPVVNTSAVGSSTYPSSTFYYGDASMADDYTSVMTEDEDTF